jgi:hypothetical protein
MSRSQIHVYTYVLRHAWLNLLSEHITAGRINQVTTKSHRFMAHLSMNHERESTRRIAKPERIAKPKKIRLLSHETSHNRKYDGSNSGSNAKSNEQKETLKPFSGSRIDFHRRNFEQAEITTSNHNRHSAYTFRVCRLTARVFR